MSVEGMWCFISGQIGSGAMESGGVVVLDTQRIYGGDSVMAYIGKYDVSGRQVEGDVESFRYNPAHDGVDVFGEPMGPSRHTSFSLAMNDDGYLVGHLARNGVELPIVLQKLRDLP